MMALPKALITGSAVAGYLAVASVTFGLFYHDTHRICPSWSSKRGCATDAAIKGAFLGALWPVSLPFRYAAILLAPSQEIKE